MPVPAKTREGPFLRNKVYICGSLGADANFKRLRFTLKAQHRPSRRTRFEDINGEGKECGIELRRNNHMKEHMKIYLEIQTVAAGMWN